eukprot:6214047-Pleurochrysis_carterae.AAC.5
MVHENERVRGGGEKAGCMGRWGGMSWGGISRLVAVSRSTESGRKRVQGHTHSSGSCASA